MCGVCVGDGVGLYKWKKKTGHQVVGFIIYYFLLQRQDKVRIINRYQCQTGLFTLAAKTVSTPVALKIIT